MISKLVDRIIDGRDYQNGKERERVGTISGVLGIVLNFLLFSIKGLLGLFTGSISIIADAFNNLTDFLNNL